MLRADRPLADEIRAAFADVPPPTDADFDPVDPKDAPTCEKVRRDWLARDWRSLDAAFLDTRTEWPFFRPRAMHYFMPAFLLAALEPGAHRAHVDAIMILGPAAHTLALGTRDDRLEERLAPLDRYQGRCAAALLAHLVTRADAAPYVRWCAAIALEHVWGGHPAARALLDELVSWRRPRADDDARERLIETIEAGFAATPAPAPDDLRGSELGEEPYEVELSFRGVDWRHASPLLLNIHDAALAFLSHAAHRYFLPAFLVADVLELLRVTDPVYYLTHGLARGDADDRFALFTPPERAAVVAYLQWRADDPVEHDAIERALAEFWDAEQDFE